MEQSNRKERVLFICIHNSVRSQMAEGLLHHYYGNRFEVHSAGSHPRGVDPLAVKVMAEVGIDISNHLSKSLKEFEGQEFDYVITVCDSHYICPVFFNGKKYIKQSFDDPLAINGSSEERIRAFRRIRDELSDWICNQFTSPI
ncbi:arsenate reductase ArsC [Methanobacterium petrolearium]|uniref:arsenate reductase ArsC n=1 Tax=Methanobacterium petrolearium TaxID=710190 RepID=UPI001AEB17B2|nr:arsenate reductase ArsC [Methanobacterium petrolearium]MBP1946849.1 arsenate reductase [Methanobacterium petrolearium]BDZ70461.1 protein-tyrosine-phosphatase [Methanobacterium petrolearium]